MTAFDLTDATVVRWSAPGHRATVALAEVVHELQALDPLQPVTVAVPSNIAGLQLRRALGRRSGLCNVRFLVLDRVVELLLSAAGAGEPVASPHEEHEAVRLAMLERPWLFADVVHHRSSVRAVAELLVEWERRSPAERQILMTQSALAAELDSLSVAVQRRLAGKRRSTEAATAAADALGAVPTLAGDLGVVVVAFPTDVRSPQILRALLQAHRLQVVAIAIGEPAVDDRLVAQLEACGLVVPTVSQQPAAPQVRVVVAPDVHTEVAAAVRAVHRAAAAGVPLHRIAVAAAAPHPYVELLHHEFRRAGLHANGPSPVRLSDCAVGRTLIGLGRLDPRLLREPVLAWASSSPIVDGDGRLVPAVAWRRIARRAGVVRGASQWQSRLRRFAEANRERGGGDRADRAESLAGFVAEVVGYLPRRSPQRWSEHARWAREVLERYLPSLGARGSWPDHELAAVDTVEGVLAALSALDPISPAVPIDVFLDALDEALAVPIGRVGRFGDGVYVGSLADSMHADIDLLVIVGALEGVLPGPARDPALLGAIDPGPRLERQAARRAVERRVFRSALVSAPEIVVSMPLVDPTRARAAWPAPWLLELLATDGQAPSGENVLSGQVAAVEMIASRQSQVTDAATAAVALDFSLAEGLIGGEWPDDPEVARRFAAVRAALGDEPGPWDGIVGPGVIALDPDDPISPTRLETWATCPRRSLLSAVLGLSDTDEPVDVDSIEARDEGSVVHEALEEFISRHLGQGPDQPWTSGDIDEALEILDRVADRFEALGRTGSGLAWEITRERLRRELRTTIEHDSRQRAAGRWVPTAVEVAFGIDGEPPAQLAAGDHHLAFRGYIDRLDVSTDGSRVRVIDYKTGKPLSDRELVAGRANGTRLQLPIYALRAAELYPEAQVASGYWYISGKGSHQRREMVLDDAARDELVTVVRTIVDGMTAGLFPANPGAEGANCTWCPFTRICPADREDTWQRQQQAAVVGPYRRLSKPEPKS